MCFILLEEVNLRNLDRFNLAYVRNTRGSGNYTISNVSSCSLCRYNIFHHKLIRVMFPRKLISDDFSCRSPALFLAEIANFNSRSLLKSL